jgi:mannose-6-phosphate isomerase-like protein (cupin superfamily)
VAKKRRAGQPPGVARLHRPLQGHRRTPEEVFLVQEGTATFTAGDDVIEASGGQILVVPVGVHDVVVEGDLVVLHATMSGRHVRTFVDYDADARPAQAFQPTGRRFATTPRRTGST